MTDGEHITFCRICEPMCGMIATVEDGRLVRLRTDQDNPWSQGFGCAKGPAMVDVVHDPDRVLTPLRRTGGPGEFEPVTWDEAMDDIVERLRTTRTTIGPSAIAVAQGNPSYFSYSAAFWARGLQKAIGSPWFYGMNSEDASSRVAAAAILYGSPAALPIPDIARAHTVVLIGANPWVSKGSLFHEPRLRDRMDAVVERGGRIFVIDPRATETAQRYEHIAITPGTDAHLLLSVLYVLDAERLVDDEFVEQWTTGWPELRKFVRRYSPEATAEVTGIDPDTCR